MSADPAAPLIGDSTTYSVPAVPDVASGLEHDFSPWTFWRQATDAQIAAQRAFQRDLAVGRDITLGERVFVSPLAAVHPEHLVLGDRGYIAAHAYVTGVIDAGADCTVNAFTVVRGTVRLGDGIRIGAHSSLLAFNHGMAPDRPVFRQPTTSVGITVGDDVWIGSHAVILDGVAIGEHSVVGAGSVVTRDVAPWSVVGGNPARVLRDRRGGVELGARAVAGQSLADRLAGFADRARAQAPDVLDRCWNDPAGRFLDRPGVTPTVRACCDAVEIADLLMGTPPPQRPRESIAEILRDRQDEATGLVPDYGATGPLSLDDGTAAYHVLCAGYALNLLGTSFAHPVRAALDLSGTALTTRLDALPWRDRGWSAGAWIDCYGTAALRNLVDHGLHTDTETLFGWLLTRADPWHGMWGAPDPAARWLQVVNGYYRLTRGTFAQFGLPVPYAERSVDTLLQHGHDPAYFGPDRGNACNVLDVIHPLWLARKQTSHRSDEARRWATAQLDRALTLWVDGAGFSFAAEPGPGRDGTPGLQGTEMWLAVIWLLADYVGSGDALGYRPRGVHRPEPAASLR